MSKFDFTLNLNKQIVEMMALLSEYMQKIDRLLDRMDKHDILFEKQFARMDLAYQVIVGHSEKIEALEQQTNRITEETNRITEEARQIKEALLKQEVKNEALLNEILSISKRVLAIEGNK